MTLPEEDAMEIAVYMHRELGVGGRQRAADVAEEEDFPRFAAYIKDMTDREFDSFLQKAREETEETEPAVYTHESRIQA